MSIEIAAYKVGFLFTVVVGDLIEVDEEEGIVSLDSDVDDG